MDNVRTSRALIQPGVHPIAVKLDFVEPVGSVRRRVDQFDGLRLDPRRQSDGLGAPPPPAQSHHRAGTVMPAAPRRVTGNPQIR